jgi:dipeptidyl aminopeptidase/acylaminoacyl peptidase
VSTRKHAPCGGWPSPIGPDTVANGSVRLGGICLDGADPGAVYWLESRAAEKGRLTLLCKRGGSVGELLKAPFSVRNRVHEYGGGAFAVADGVVIFCNDGDQQLYRLDTRSSSPRGPEPLTTCPGMRFADLQIDKRHGRVICVAERARAGGEPENLLVQVELTSGAVTELVAGADFYAFPRLDPRGRRLAYLCWNHPAMPWDACELHVAEIGSNGSPFADVRIAGDEAEAIFQPSWSPDGVLHFISDRSGYGNLHRVSEDGHIERVCPMEAEFSTPQWVFGLSTYGWLDERTLACVYQSDGFWHLARLATDTGQLVQVPSDLTELGWVFAHGGHAVFVGGSPAKEPALYRFAGEHVELLHDPGGHRVSEDSVSLPRPIDFPTSEGAISHGLYYPPTNPSYAPLPEENPPLLVISHGGPTGSTSSALSLAIQFWTSRGFGVLDVNYRGSTGYGRAYRKMLDGNWGLFDVEDCVAGAHALAGQGLVDGRRMAIRGSSAGGLTVLCALAFHDVFSAGASYYGVCDLVALATDTHKFESRYLDSLIGPYPEREDLYRARSPVYAADRISCPVIFFQGTEDRVVPPAQAQAMVEALRQRGLEAPLFLFPDEQHGFRRRETVIAALTAELDFYRKVFAIRTTSP